ncbi:MAG: DUF4382 domain-containing protein [Gemmatimonadales bacterium]
MLPHPTRQLVVAAALAVVASLGLNACDGGDMSTAPEGTPRLTLLFGGGNTLPATVGDASLFADDGVAPTEVWVKIEDVCLQGVGDGDQEGDQNGRVCLLDAPTDWLEIAGPSEEWVALVDGTEVPAGAHQLRFVIMDVVIFVDGTETDDVYATSNEALADLNAFNETEWTKTGIAQCPSCKQSGLKVSFPSGDPDLQNGDYVFLAQFDVSESFGKLRGNSGRWVMHPHIRGSLVDGGPVDGPASISGTVSVASGATLNGDELPGSCGGEDVTADGLLAMFKPSVSNGTSAQATPDPSTGEYEIAPLEAPATYTLSWLEPISLGSSTLTFTVVVTDPDGSPNDQSTDLVPGQAATVDYEITALTCTDGP